MKEKIICDFDCEVENIKIFKCYRLVVDENNIMHLYYACKEKEFAIDIITNKTNDETFYVFGNHFHFPMAKVPEVVKAMTECFYTCNPWKNIWGISVDLDDSSISFSINFEERLQRMNRYTIYQTNGKHYGEEGRIHESVDLEWEDAEPVYADDKKRKMPKGLAVLIKGIKDYYNAWQKEHPEYERIK